MGRHSDGAVVMRLLAVLVLAGFLSSPVAAAPEGFRDSTRLSPIVAAISGKPAPAYCARTSNAWTALMRSAGAPLTSTGYVPSADDMAYLNLTACQRLEGWLRGKNMPTLETLGWSALTLTHEAMHVRGIEDEGATDCAALAALPGVLRVHFKIRKAATLRVVMAAAWRKHRLSGPAYRGSCGL